MNEKDNHLLTVELSEEQNDNMLDGILNNLPPSPLPKGPEKKELDRVKEPHTSGAGNGRNADGPAQA